MEQYHFSLGCKEQFNGKKINEEMGDYTISFMGQIDDFEELTLGKGQGLYSGTEVVIRKDGVCIYNAVDHSLAASFEIDLEITQYLGVVIRADLLGEAMLEIGSIGGRVEREIPWNGRMGCIFALCGEKTSFSQVTMSYHANGWQKPIWLFGDSYLNLTSPARWTSYLTKKEPRGVMLNGFPGRNSQTALQALETALEQGTPKELVWCLGMNDGDSEDHVNANWLEVTEKIRKICQEKAIRLVLSTIPSCKVNNRYKNAIVRSSGLRFIDFERAVGAHLYPFWYEGLIEEGQDKVHPSEKGAVALYHQAIADCPELLG